MERRAERVSRRGDQFRSDPGGEGRSRVVGRNDVVVAVEDHRRIRLVGAEEPVKRLMDRGHLGLVERSFDVLRRVAGGEQQPVPLA